MLPLKAVLCPPTAVARTTGIDRSAVELHRSLLGGAFGRRSVFSMDFVTSAAWLSKVLRQPVKVIWDRADDIRYGHFKPMTAQKLRAAIDADGNINARITASHVKTRCGVMIRPCMKGGAWPG